jgi:hypothetical protein
MARITFSACAMFATGNQQLSSQPLPLQQYPETTHILLFLKH